MSKFEFDQNKKELTYILAAVIIFIASIFMFFGSLSRFSVSGEKNEKGRLEITVTDYFFYIVPHNSVTVSPVTNARFISGKEEIERYLKKIDGDSAADSSFSPFTVLFTTKDEYRLDGKRADYPLEEKINFFTDLDSFITDPEQTDFNKSFGNFGFAGVLGIILMAITLFYIVPRAKNIKQLVLTEVKKIDFSKQVKQVKEQVKKKETKPVKEKQSSVYELEPTVSKTLRVLIPAYYSSIKYDLSFFKLPEIDEIAFVCTSEQKADLELRYKNDFKYLVCDNLKGIADMVLKAEEWLKDYTGYLFVQTSNIPELNAVLVNKMFRDHKEKDCECTFLTKEVLDKKISNGKVVRSVANKIIRISELEELNDNSDQPGETFAGLFCFNTKNLFKVLAKLNINGSKSDIPLTRIVETYYKNSSRVNSYPIALPGSTSRHDNLQPVFERKQEIAKKSNAAIVLSVDNPSADQVLRSFDLVSSISDIGKIGIITSKNKVEEFKTLFEDKAVIIASDGGLGDGFDVLSAQDLLKGFKGNIVVVPENSREISHEMMDRLLSEHNGRENTCTYYKLDGNNIFCCVGSDYFFYSAKRIIRDDEARKYFLSQITEILVNDKKRVQEITRET